MRFATVITHGRRRVCATLRSYANHHHQLVLRVKAHHTRAMEDYLRQRQELILKDRALRHDYAPNKEPSLDEVKADKLLRNIRTTEAEIVWDPNRKVDHPHGSQQMFPGMEFLTGE